MTPWVWLALAILNEVGGTISMKLSEGFTRLGPSVAMAVLYCASLGCLTMALKQIDIGLAYAIWAGTGTALIAIAGVAIFNEPMSMLKGSCLLLIIIGVVGLRLSGVGE